MPAARRLTPAVLARLFGGWVLVVGGGILTPLPIPVGLLLFGLGLAVLARDSRMVRHGVRRLRARYPGLSARLNDAGRRAPRWLARLIRLTEPRRGRTDGKTFRDP
jgi:hypothetical protein